MARRLGGGGLPGPVLAGGGRGGRVLLLLSLLKCNTVIKLSRDASLQSVPRLHRNATIFSRSLTEVVVVTLAQTGRTAAEESSCMFLLAQKQNVQLTALETIETRVQHVAFSHS